MAAMYELGGWQDNSDYTDPLRDRNGNPAVVANATTRGWASRWQRTWVRVQR
ncbi:putative carbohydrate-selective porin OprB [Xanthomonas citri pv. fuscans]|nr:putative carbohydrate-selective porin OprB [Xanthomonas citri pv. fuscans]